MSAAAAPDAEFAPGTILLGKYRVDAIVGQGGMGVVVAATHLGLNERVAIKFLRGDVVHADGAMPRFLREAQAAAKLKSEHVARVMDVGTFASGAPYMVMEFLEGIDLGVMLEQNGRLAPALTAELGLQACAALAEAHAAGIIHRDIKPENLFITWRPDGSPLLKLVDFGISKAVAGVDVQLTQTQSMLGTPAYMSPEQMRSARLVDARSDQWSLGVVLYELVAGRRPFEADSFSELVVMVISDPPAPLPPDVPPALASVILRCLARSADDRYPTIAELGAALAPLARDPRQAALLVERMQRGPLVPGRRAPTPEPVAAAVTPVAPPVAPAAPLSSPPAAPLLDGPATIPTTPMLGDERTLDATTPMPALTAVVPARTTIDDTLHPAAAPPAGRGARVALVLGALALVGGGLAFALTRGSSAPDATPTSTPPTRSPDQAPAAVRTAPDARLTTPPDARLAPPADAAPPPADAAPPPADAAPPPADARKKRDVIKRPPKPGCDPSDILNCRKPATR